MAAKHSFRGFTRIDALVAGVACLLLIPLVPMVLAMTQEHYFRIVCAGNLAQIGKTMFLYANDNDSNLPRAGGRNTIWGSLPNWAGATRMQAFGLNADGTGGTATISSSLYLLVKYCQAPTKLFICPGDSGTTEFRLSDAAAGTNLTLADIWDFGPAAIQFKSCSFAYHIPYTMYALTTSRDPNLAVAADRNPWIKSPGADPAVFTEFKPDVSWMGGTAEQARVGNAPTHEKDGQNVLFLDGRVVFETRAFCSANQDNIYTSSRYVEGGDAMGDPWAVSRWPLNDEDSLLVHDPDTLNSGVPHPR